MVYNKMFGYLLGFLFTAVIAVISLFLLVMFIAMSMGGSNGGLLVIMPLLVIGGYLLTAYIMALFAKRTFNSHQWLAFALNISSVMFIIFLVFSQNQYHHYKQMRKGARNAQIAVADAPYIHLEAPFIKKVLIPNGGVVMFLHVPFTTNKIVRAKSLSLLIPLPHYEKSSKFSSNPSCNSGISNPQYGFYIVDQEHNQPPVPSRSTAVHAIVSDEELEPNKRYFLLRELYFSAATCKISDYDDFDERDLTIKLNTSRAEQAR
jgi:hypothetical protein